MSIGQLVVSLGLDASTFISGMTKSEAQAKQFAQSLDRNIAAGIIKAQIALEALGAGARIAAEAFKVLTSGAGEFKDLEDSTGASAESLASLAVSASVAGVQMADVAGAANKLAKNMVGVDDESKAAGAALKAIGINIKEFKALDPVSQYQAVGKALAGYADGADKVAVSMALFGKGGAEQLRVFKELEAEGGALTILTQRQIELADDYSDRQAKSVATLRLYAQAAATEALPALTDLTNAGTEYIKSLLGVDDAAKQLSANNLIKTFAEDATVAVAVLAESLVGLVKIAKAVGGSFQSVAADAKLLAAVAATAMPGGLSLGSLRDIKEAFAERQRMAAEANQRYIDLWNQDGARLSKAIQNAQAFRHIQEKSSFGAFPNPDNAKFSDLKPKIDFKGADTEGAARVKKLLDGQIKAIQDFAQQQKDAYEFANKFVQGTYNDGLISLRQFFDEQTRIRDAGLASQLQALDKEKAALEAALPKTKEADRIEIENKIAEVVRKRADVVEKAGRDGVMAAQDEARALLQLRDRYDDLRATIKQLSGDSAGASAIRIAQQVADARKLITQAGGNPAQADELNRLLSQTEALNQAQRDYASLVDHSRDAEELLLLAAQEGGKSELATRKAVGVERQKTLEQMGLMVAKANELAATLNTDEARLFAERLGLAFKKATAEVDPLLQKIRDVGKDMGDSIASSFEDAIVEGKGLRETLKGIETDLVRIITRNAVTKPLGDYLGNLIGGNGQASGGGGLIGSLIGSAMGFFGGGSSAVDSSVWNFGSTISGLGKAIGGPTMPNSIYQVGERKPEVYDDGSRQWLLTGSRRGRIDPNPAMGSAGRTMVVNNHFTVQGQTDRRSQSQIAAAAARGLATANSRDN